MNQQRADGQVEKQRGVDSGRHESMQRPDREERRWMQRGIIMTTNTDTGREVG